MTLGRRSILLCAGAVGIGALGARASGTPASERPQSYTEDVSSVLITKDGTQIIFLSNQYTYIFDAPQPLTRSLTSSFREMLQADISRFNVKKDQSISGNVQLRLNKDVPDEQQAAAEGMGFKRIRSPDGSSYCEYQGALQGKRFGKTNTGSADLQKLAHDYHVSVFDEGAEDRTRSTSPSPIRLAVGGVLLIGIIPLLIIFSLFGAHVIPIIR